MHPLDGQPVLLAAATASVGPARLDDLLERVQAHLDSRVGTYRETYERVHATDERELFLVEEGYWERLGGELALDDREWDAVRRAHERQLRYLGRRRDRDAEYETALDIREAVVVGV